jgi:bifunctional enzyme CysN/CysC
MKIGTSTVTATITRPKYRIDVNTLAHDEPRTTLELNEIGVCNISLDRAIPFDPYSDNRNSAASS